MADLRNRDREPAGVLKMFQSLFSTLKNCCTLLYVFKTQHSKI